MTAMDIGQALQHLERAARELGEAQARETTARTSFDSIWDAFWELPERDPQAAAMRRNLIAAEKERNDAHAARVRAERELGEAMVELQRAIWTLLGR
jgi:hypothetical protein